MDNKLAEVSRKIGYEFQDVSLLTAALSHRSVRGENNERLEFLGDSLLNFIIAAALYDNFSEAREGELSRYRANLVCGKVLAELGKGFDLGNYLRLGAGELKSGGFQRDSIIADGVEAIIGAIYLDAGMEPCRACVLNWYKELIKAIAEGGLQKDAKTRLQEHLQAQRLPLPSYEITKTVGDAHARTFFVECKVKNLPYVTKGSANTRRDAEQIAAEKFLELMHVENN